MRHTNPYDTYSIFLRGSSKLQRVGYCRSSGWRREEIIFKGGCLLVYVSKKRVKIFHNFLMKIHRTQIHRVPIGA